MAIFNKIIIEEGTTLEAANEVLDELDDEIFRVDLKLKFLRDNIKIGGKDYQVQAEKLHRYYSFLRIKQKKYRRYANRLSVALENANALED